MMKYIELKNGEFIAEHAVHSIGVEDGEIFVQCLNQNGQGFHSKKFAAQTGPMSIESVIVALRLRLAEQQG
jgi:hypothetical protein